MRPEPTAQRSADPVGRRARALCRASCLATRGRGDNGRGSFGHAGRGCVALRTCAAISSTIPCLYFFRIAHMRFTRLVCTRGTTATVRQSNDSCSTKDVRQGTLNLCVDWRWHPTTIALEASATAAPQTSRQLQVPRSTAPGPDLEFCGVGPHSMSAGSLRMSRAHCEVAVHRAESGALFHASTPGHCAEGNSTISLPITF